ASRITDIRQMKARVEKERIPLGEDRDFHLKLGPGGLVDVEFLVQLMQLRHGGRDPTLRLTSTRRAITALAKAEVLGEEEAAALIAAYEFCTQVRNRLYLQAGRPIDSLPRDPAEERRLAISLGYERRGDLREESRPVTRRARRLFGDHSFPCPPGSSTTGQLSCLGRMISPEQLRGLVAEVLPAVTELRRAIHRHPELSFHEFTTTQRVANLLADRGLEPVVRPEGTGLTVEVGQPGHMVGFRADLDALPIQEPADN